jgi:PAS domain S-box-containing protein
MRAQEEEMRQNMEELEATQEQMNRSVAELAAIKENLEKEKYLLDALMDNLPDAIYFKDRESKFIRVSKYLADHFNSTVSDLMGKSDFDFQDVSHAQEAFDDEMNIMATRKPKIDYIEREVASDGTEHWVSTTKMPLVNHLGQVVGTFGVSRDISKLKNLEKDFVIKEKKLAETEKEFRERVEQLEKMIQQKEAEIQALKKAHG